MPPKRYSSSSEEKKTTNRKKSSPSSSEEEPATIRITRSPEAKSPVRTPIKKTGKTLPPSAPRKETAFRYESDDEKRPRGRGIIPDNDSDSDIDIEDLLGESSDSTDESEDESINRMANIASREPRSEVEKIPAPILSKIASFLSNTNRPTMSLISPTMRKVMRNLPVDLSEINFSYTNLIKFLGTNPDLKIVGLKLIPNGGDLSELRPYLRNLTKLIVNRANIARIDYSILLECKKLTHCVVKQKGEVLPYLVNCGELEYLVIEGSEEKDLIVKNKKLKQLEIYNSPLGELRLTKCKRLTSLKLYNVDLESIKLPVNNSLTDLLMYDVKNVNFSFLDMCKSLKRLEITLRETPLNLDTLSGLEKLEKLVLYCVETNGNLDKLKMLKELTLDVFKLGSAANPELPKLPPTLESLEIIPADDENYGTKFSLESLLDCPNLRHLLINLQEASIDLKHLDGCVNLRYLKLDINKLLNTESLEKLSSLTNLNLIVRGMMDIEANLFKCPLLRTVKVTSGEIDSINFLKNCINLTELIIRTKSITSLDILSTCTNLEKLTIYGFIKGNMSPLLNLKGLAVVIALRSRLTKNQKRELESMGFRNDISSSKLLLSYKKVTEGVNMDVPE